MDKKFKNNKEFNKFLISDLKKRFAKVKLGGGQKRIDKLHKKGKMSARERIDYLFDNKSKSIEIGAFAGDKMYEEHGGCPCGGVVVKIGYISKAPRSPKISQNFPMYQQEYMKVGLVSLST